MIPKEVATPSKPPVVVPLVVVAVTVHVALVVLVERDEMCNLPAISPPFEYSQGCILFVGIKPIRQITPSSFRNFTFGNTLLRANDQQHSETKRCEIDNLQKVSADFSNLSEYILT